MRTKHVTWTINDLRRNIGRIEYPEFQREPTVWNLEKKQRLIDSILRDFDISSIYFHEREDGQIDCVDGRQRINAILSYLGMNRDEDPHHNDFNLRIENEIYDDKHFFDDVQSLRYADLPDEWKEKIEKYRLNIVLVTDLQDEDEGELNLLFLRLQIASVLNAGEKLHAMTGDMRDLIFADLSKYDMFKEITIPSRRFAREQVASQIVLNVFGLRKDDTFKRSRFTDLQKFFKQYQRFEKEDKAIIKEIRENLKTVYSHFSGNLKWIRNRAMAVSVYLFVSGLVEQGKEAEIGLFVKFIGKFLKTLKWQIPKGIDIDREYRELLSFQTSVSQAAGERYAIQNRHTKLGEYYYYFKKNDRIIGDKEYKKANRKDPDQERKSIRL